MTFKEMNGGGLHMEMKRFYQKIMDENPNLIKDVKETKKTVDAIQQHKFFKEYLKEDDKIKKEYNGNGGMFYQCNGNKKTF